MSKSQKVGKMHESCMDRLQATRIRMEQISSLAKTWFKSNFKLDNPNYTIKRRDRLSWQGRGVAILVRNDIKFDVIGSLTRAPSLFS